MVRVTRKQVLDFRWRSQQLDHAPGTARSIRDVALLDFGVQDTGLGGAAWALANRGLSAYDEKRMLLAWTIRMSPHLYRRSYADQVALATSPFDGSDGAARIFDAAKQLRSAGVDVLEAMSTIARAERRLVHTPTAKGELSARLSDALEETYRRWCNGCQSSHVYEGPFRLAALQAGLEL